MIGRHVSRFSVIPWTRTIAGAPSSPATSWASSMGGRLRRPADPAGVRRWPAMPFVPYGVTLHPDVLDALDDGTPLVALESTIISHGMPFPQNVEMATEVEQLVRAEGAVPATIAVIDGRPCIGLDEAQLHQLAAS